MRIYNLNTELTFGMYKGHSMKYIIDDNNWLYIFWMVRNIPDLLLFGVIKEIENRDVFIPEDIKKMLSDRSNEVSKSGELDQWEVHQNIISDNDRIEEIKLKIEAERGLISEEEMDELEDELDELEKEAFFDDEDMIDRYDH